MRIELFLSLRLLRDSRTQSILIGLGVAVGVGVVVFLSALISGLQEDLIQKTVGSQAHVSIKPPDETARRIERSSDAVYLSQVERVAQRVRSIDGWQALLERLDTMRGVRSATPICRGPGKVSRAAASYNVVLSGIEPVSYERTVGLRNKIVMGGMGLQGRGALVGKRLAKQLGVGVGDKIRLEAGTQAQQSAEIFEIRGLFELGNRVADEGWVFVSLRNAQTLLSIPGGATELEAAVDAIFDAEAIAGRIRAETGMDAESWMESNEELLAGLRSQSASSTLIQVFVLLAVAIGIASVLVVSVVQRKQEIGILRAIGLTRRHVQRIFLIQGCLLALAGSIAGAAMGAGLLKVFMRYAKNEEGQPLFPIEMTSSLFLMAGAVAVVVGLIAALLPARSAAKLDPAVAIRNE